MCYCLREAAEMPWHRGRRRHGFLSGGALQESPESPTWTGSRFPWQRRTNRRKHWGNPVILQHWAIINTPSGEGSRSWYSSNPYRARGRGTSNQNHCWSCCGCMFFGEEREFARSCFNFLNVYILFFFFFLRFCFFQHFYLKKAAPAMIISGK